MATPTVLLCTVGGSPDPIVKAIDERKPDHVVFLCTGPSPGNPGSRVQIEGPVPPPPAASSRPHDPRTIPERAGLAAGRFEIVEVPADDPDGVFWEARRVLRALRARKELRGARIWVDYTGGTKSMTAGLLAAAIGLDAATRPQLVTGERADLVQVTAGTERAREVPVDALLADRMLAQAEALWARFAYAAAAELLAPVHESLAVAERAPESLREAVRVALRASAMFAAWDRFDHAGALVLARDHGLFRLDALRPFDQPLRKLADPTRRLPLLLLDLWHAALRAAVRGAFDDAVARCYRLVEATAQHLLATRLGIETSALEPARFLDRLPEKDRPHWQNRKQAGLVDAWRLFLALEPEHGAAQALARERPDGKPMDGLQRWLERRNYSLLAHGFAPVGAEGWAEVRGWMERFWLDGVWPHLAPKGLVLRQLPTSLSGLTESL